MKSIIQSSVGVLLFTMLFSFSNTLSAQTADDNGKQYVEIKTSAVCGSCKHTIESALSKVDGVESAKLDVDTKVVAVKYDGSKTNADAIKTAITKSGYDADDMPADKAAYDHLDGCCKKD